MTVSHPADTLSPTDRRLVEEAIRRLRAARPDCAGPQDLYATLADQIRRGRRDLFTLMRAGRRWLDGI